MQVTVQLVAGQGTVLLEPVAAHPAPGPGTATRFEDDGQALNGSSVVPLLSLPARKGLFWGIRNH
jgi:hypothetical protein